MAQIAEEDFIDLKTIPKIQFQLIDQQLIKTIKDLSFQIKSHDKALSEFKKELNLRVKENQLAQSFQLLQSNIDIPNQISSNSKKKTNNIDSQNPQVKSRNSCLSFSNKLSQITEIVSLVFNKMTALEKQVNSSESKLTHLLKQKTGSIQDRFQHFIKQNRQKIDAITLNIKANADSCSQQIKEMEANTLWKINQCNKRLQEKPTVQMVKMSVQHLQQKVFKNIGSNSSNVSQSSLNSDFFEHKILKLQKQINFKFVQTQSKLSNLSEQIANQYLTSKKFDEYMVQSQKRFQNLLASSGQVFRRIKFLQGEKQQQKKNLNQFKTVVDNTGSEIQKFKKQLSSLTLGEQLVQLLQKIDPHQVCKLSSRVQNIEEQSLQTKKRVSSLSDFLDLIRSKTQFWGLANSKPTQIKQSSSLNSETLKAQIMVILQQSDINTKIRGIQNQISGLTSVKDAVNGIMKSLSKYNKDNDLTNIRYQIKGLQEYLKRELLIQNDRINSLQVSVNDVIKLNKRPKSSSGKIDDSRLQTSVSTKKLVSLNCLSCYQTEGIVEKKMVNKRSIYDNYLKK